MTDKSKSTDVVETPNMEDNIVKVDFPDARETIGKVPQNDPFKGFQKMEKKVSAGKKVTRQEAFSAMQDMRQITTALVNDFVKIVQEQSLLDNGLQRLYTLFSVFVELMIRQKVCTREDFQELYKELVEKPMKEAQEKVVEKTKKESAEAAQETQERSMPECGYCGKSDCEFCNSLESESSKS